MAWTAPSGHVFATGEVVTAATMNTYIKDNLIDLDRRATLVKAEVGTNQSTTSTSYTDLTTVGPAVTVSTGALCLVGVIATQSNSGVAGETYMGFAISGATTVAASDEFATRWTSSTANAWGRLAGVFAVASLTPGSNTFTAKYKVNAGTGSYIGRRIFAVPLGSA
jgi:hypothetical protein